MRFVMFVHSGKVLQEDDRNRIVEAIKAIERKPTFVYVFPHSSLLRDPSTLLDRISAVYTAGTWFDEDLQEIYCKFCETHHITWIKDRF